MMKFSMAFDIFCPTKSSKSSRKSSTLQQNRHNEATQQVDTNTNNHPNNSNTNKNSNNLNPVSWTNLKFVNTNFIRVEDDEINAERGDVVLCEYPSADNPDWIYVLNFRNGERGFLPIDILSSELKALELPKKKLPRSMADHSMIDHHHHHHHHHHQHGRAHSHKTHCTSERTCHSNGGSIKLHQPHHLRLEHQPQFELALNSLQGSSGCQTFQKFPDFSHFSPPSYYNLDPAAQIYNKVCPFDLNAYPDCYVAMHNFVAREENDLEVKPGDYAMVLNKDDPNWFWVRREYDGREGFVPSNFICPLEQVHAVMQKGNSTVTMKSCNRNGDNHTYINQVPERESLTTDPQSSLFP